MKRQVVKITDGPAQYKVIFDDEAEKNQYKIYRFWKIKGEVKDWMDHEWKAGKQRQKLIKSYSDLVSCLYYLGELIQSGKPPMSEKVVIKETFKRR